MSAITLRFYCLTPLVLVRAIANMLGLGPMFLQQLAARLRAARAATDITQEQAAEAVGVSQQSIANYERARAEIGASTLYALALLYGVSVDWLCTGSTPMPHLLASAAG